MQNGMQRERPMKRRVSRRWFLGAAGVSAAAAGFAAIRCTGGSGEPGQAPDDDPSPSNGSGSAPTAEASPTAGAAGGNLRITGFIESDGAYDPHRTTSASFIGLQAAVYSRLLAYENIAEGTIVPDLAANQPEQPDASTYVFKLNPAATWQQREPVNGRKVTSGDVKSSIERQRDGDILFPRKTSWANVTGIDTPDDETLTITLGSPLAAMHHFFADVSAVVVPPELTADGAHISLDRQVGSGPFEWVEWAENDFASLVRNDSWWGGDSQPRLDGVTVHDIRRADYLEGLLRTHRLDLAFVGRPLADRLKESLDGLQETSIGESRFWGVRFFTVIPPWNDLRVRTAATIALDRRAMLDQFFDGEGELNPWVSWPVKRWSLPQSELQSMPGYRVGAAGRERDLTEAKQMLASYQSEGGTLPQLGLIVLDEAEAALGFGSIIREQLVSSLGLDVVVYPVSGSELGPSILSNQFPWVAWPDDGWADLDDWVHPYFHSTGTKNTFPLRDPDMDSLIEAQRLELDEDARREIGYDIQRRLLQMNIGVNLLSERVIALSRTYVKDFPLDVDAGWQRRLTNTWIDLSDENYRA